MRHVLFIVAAAALLAGAGTVQSAPETPQPEIIAHGPSGIAFSYLDGEGEGATVIALDPVAAWEEQAAVTADCDRHQVSYKGAVWCFASAANKDLFAAEMGNEKGSKYLPFLGGRCALGVASNHLGAVGDPRTAVRVGDRLMANGSFAARSAWLKDTERHVDRATLFYEVARDRGLIVPNDQIAAAN